MAPARYCRILVLIMLAGLLPATGQCRSIQHYHVELTTDPDRLTVSTCLKRQGLQRFRATGVRAIQALDWMRLEQTEGMHELRPSGRQVAIARSGQEACLVYRVRLAELAARQSWNSRGGATAVWMTDPDDWLWLPVSTAQSDIEVDFDLPEGLEVSVPWQPVEPDDGGHRYRLPNRPAGWDTMVAFGALSRVDIPIVGGRLRVAVLPSVPAIDHDVICDWIMSGARAIISLYGRFPVPAPQILILPSGRADEPVPWAVVKRGGGEAVHLYVDPSYSRRAFIDDWTLVHELSHFIHPRMPRADAWLYEGLASYYQNVLRGRTGLLSPETAWRKLHEGFLRGRNDTDRRQPLFRIARDMYRNRRYMQVYWSGAAYALAADVQLRRSSAGKQSLDTVLARFQACCLPTDHYWSGKTFAEKLDELGETRLFSELYEEYVDLKGFPDLRQLYRDLGLKARGRSLHFDDNAPLATLRWTIMSARPVR